MKYKHPIVPEEAKPIIRGQLYFYVVGETVVCTLGDAQDTESETIFQVHISHCKDIVAGLVATSGDKHLARR